MAYAERFGVGYDYYRIYGCKLYDFQNSVQSSSLGDNRGSTGKTDMMFYHRVCSIIYFGSIRCLLRVGKVAVTESIFARTEKRALWARASCGHLARTLTSWTPPTKKSLQLISPAPPEIDRYPTACMGR